MFGKTGLIVEQTKTVLLAAGTKITILDRHTYIFMTVNMH